MGCSSCAKRRRQRLYKKPPQPAARQITEQTTPIPSPVSGNTVQQQQRKKAPKTQVNETTTPTPTVKRRRNFRQIPKNGDNK